MAKAYRRNFIDGQSLTSSSKDFSLKLFTGWDFAIIGEKAMKRKQRAMTVDLEVSVTHSTMGSSINDVTQIWRISDPPSVMLK